MKLAAFRIKRFRSIVDTDWCDLSSDNITGLVGQNESGKTSVLEALYSFYTRELKDDYRRNNGDYPEVICSFETSEEEIKKLFDDNNLPKKFFEVVKKNNYRVNLSCKWNGLSTGDAVIDLEQNELKTLFDTQEPEAPAEPAPEVPKPETAPVATAAPSGAATPPVEDKSAEVPAEPAEEPRHFFTYNEFTDGFFDSIPEFVLFTNHASRLPSEIDVVDITSDKAGTEGLIGAKNFLKIAGIDPSVLENPQDDQRRMIMNQIQNANQLVTKDFQEFWTQKVGKTNQITIEMKSDNHAVTVAGAASLQPFLEFWIHDAEGMLYPRQRSEGVRWFLSFFLQLRATANSVTKGQVLLMDEPGNSLHAKAQSDVLRLFEDIKERLQIVYTTHSPYMIETKALYRLLAVQRSFEDDNSDTKVFGIHKLGSASEDTMFPVYTLIGVDLQHQRVIMKTNNILLEEPSAHYYLMAFKQLVNSQQEMNFLPCTGASNIETYANLFLGWGLQFIAVADNDDQGKRALRKIKKDVLGNDDDLAKARLYNIEGCSGIEDIFAKTDFKKYVLEDTKLTFTEDNSAYVKTLTHNDTNFSKVYIAIRFYQKVKDNKINFTELSKTTQTNIKKLIDKIEELLKNYPV